GAAARCRNAGASGNRTPPRASGVPVVAGKGRQGVAARFKTIGTTRVLESSYIWRMIFGAFGLRYAPCNGARASRGTMIRSLSAPQRAFDIIVATLCVLLRSVLPFDSPAGWIMLLLMGAALAIRRLSPAIALAVAWAGAIIQMSGMLPPDAANL